MSFSFILYYIMLPHCLYLVLNTQETSHFYWQGFHNLKKYIYKLKLKYKREKKIPRALSELPANWPDSEKARGIFFYLYTLILIYLFKYETIVSRNGLSLGYSERDTSSVTWWYSFRNYLNSWLWQAKLPYVLGAVVSR